MYPPPPRHSPASLRYLKAKLWNLTRPSFWGTAIFLSVVGLLMRQYWTSPNFSSTTVRTQNPENTKAPESFLSEEEKAIAADIDNLPVLFYESTQQNLSTTAGKREKTQVPGEQALFANSVKQRNIIPNQSTIPSQSRLYSGAIKQQKIISPKVENPFLQQANKLLKLNNFGSNQQFSQIEPSDTTSSGRLITTSLFNSGMLNSTPSNFPDNPASTNVLQTALNQLEAKTQQQQQTLPQSSLPNNIASPIVNSNQSPSFNPNVSNPGLAVNTLNPTTAIGSLQSPYNYDRVNIQSNTQTNIQSNIQSNVQSNIQSNIQTDIRNLPPNPYNNYVTTPQPVNVNPARQLNRPVSRGVTTPNTSVAPNNYNPNLQSGYQQPNTVTNYNYSTSRQVPRQINGYYYK